MRLGRRAFLGALGAIIGLPEPTYGAIDKWWGEPEPFVLAPVFEPTPTLAAWAERMDPDGTVPQIVEMLNQTNELLGDMLYMKDNLPNGAP